jgi:hypothetical protein
MLDNNVADRAAGCVVIGREGCRKLEKLAPGDVNSALLV